MPQRPPPRRSESGDALHRLETHFADSQTYFIAAVRAYRRDIDGAFHWLDRAYTQRDPGMIGLNVDPLLRSLHSDPRFKALLRKMNLTET